MKRHVVCALIALSACSNPVKDAEQELAMIERAHGSWREICAAKRKLTAAYLQKKDEESYRLYRGSAESYCLLHELLERNGSMTTP